MKISCTALGISGESLSASISLAVFRPVCCSSTSCPIAVNADVAALWSLEMKKGSYVNLVQLMLACRSLGQDSRRMMLMGRCMFFKITGESTHSRQMFLSLSLSGLERYFQFASKGISGNNLPKEILTLFFVSRQLFLQLLTTAPLSLPTRLSLSLTWQVRYQSSLFDWNIYALCHLTAPHQ